MTYFSQCRSPQIVSLQQELDRMCEQLEQVRLQHAALDDQGVLLLSGKYTTVTTPGWSLCV